MFERHIAPVVRSALVGFPAVALFGARRCGKSVLAESLGDNGDQRRTFSLSNAVVQAAIRQDPKSFLQAVPGRLLLLHAQKESRLLDVIRGQQGPNGGPGRYLLTSAVQQLVAAPGATNPGNLASLKMWPLSQGEITGHRETFLERLLSRDDLPSDAPRINQADLWYIMSRGGFPEPVSLARHEQRDAWFDWYVEQTVCSATSDLAIMSGAQNLPVVLADVAATSAGLPARERLRRAALVFLGGSPTRWRRLKRLVLQRSRRSIPAGVRAHCTELLESLLLVDRLPGWVGPAQTDRGPNSQAHVVDTGLLCHLLDLPGTPVDDQQTFDALTFSFVVGELRKQASWSSTPVKLSHFCPRQGNQCVLVVEGGEGRCVGIVVKASNVDRAGVAALRELAAESGSRFLRGVVLCCGGDVVPFAKHIKAVPLSAIWKW